jgi:hypothetical protein
MRWLQNLASPKIQVTDPVKKILRFMSPDERKEVVRVVRLLEDDIRRDTSKFNLYCDQKDGKPTWGFTEGIVWIAFVEEDDGTITVIHATLLSRFRAHWK